MDADAVRVSKTDKVFYPDDEITKGDVIEHYRAVADVLVPHLRGRPLTLRRFPDGITGEGFFQKEASDYFPDWIRVHTVPQRGDASASVHHVVCEDAATLVYLVNQATIEFHIWSSTVDNLGNPDLMVIDLDPPEEAECPDLRRIARRVRDLFDDLGLCPFLQATGGRGFHVVAPLDASADFDTVRALASDAAECLAGADPDQLTTAQRKDKRGHRVFLDTNRNGYGQTFVAPYSLRSRPGATVATPLDWSELGNAAPNGWNPTKLRQRLAQKPDPWRDIYRHATAAEKARQKLNTLR